LGNGVEDSWASSHLKRDAWPGAYSICLTAKGFDEAKKVWHVLSNATVKKPRHSMIGGWHKECTGCNLNGCIDYWL
jgi:hypothetical protein